VIERYVEIVNTASFLLREQGVIDLDKLLELYGEEFEKLLDNAIYFNNFMIQVETFNSLFEILGEIMEEILQEIRAFNSLFEIL